MLKQFMTNGYKLPDFTYLNDRLLYIDYVDKNYEYTKVVILPIDSYRYQGNLFGVFKKLGISPSLYTYAMYLNGYTNPMNFEGKKTQFKVPVKPPIPDY